MANHEARLQMATGLGKSPIVTHVENRTRGATAMHPDSLRIRPFECLHASPLTLADVFEFVG